MNGAPQGWTLEPATPKRGKVEDPALLAQLEGGKVTDPALLWTLEKAPQRIEVDGQHFEVPADATMEEIDAITKGFDPDTYAGGFDPEAYAAGKMMDDLAKADAAGDTQLAQRIAGRIKAARTPDTHGPFAYAAHKTASYLPAAGGIAGGVMGAGLGGAFGLPAGPGAVLTGAAGAGLGAGLASAGGRALQHAIDSALGYEQDPGTAEVIKDSARTGAKDAAFTAGGAMALPMAASLAGRLAPAVDALGNRLGRRVLSGGATPLTVKKAVSPAGMDAAQEAGAFRPFGTTGSASRALDAARESTGDQYGQIVAQLEAKGVAGPDAAKLANEYLAKAASSQANTLNQSVPEVYASSGEQLRKLPGQLRLTQAENMKRSLQDMARSSYQKLDPTAVGEAKEEAASMMRQAVEDSVSRQAGLAPEEASAFVPVKQKLGSLIEASNAATKGAAQAERRGPISLIDLLAGGMGAHGGPLRGAATAAGSKLLRTYGPSTATWALKGGSDALESLAATPGLSSLRAGAGVGAAAGDAADSSTSLTALLEALRRKRLQGLRLASEDNTR